MDIAAAGRYPNSVSTSRVSIRLLAGEAFSQELEEPVDRVQ
jgi:hypothetical protein